MTVGETGASCNSFCSNPCGVKRAEYLKFLSISLVVLERDIFKLTKGFLKSNLNACITTRPVSEYVGRDETLEGVSCNTD